MKKNIEQQLQDEVYLPFVDSLYANRSVVVFGAIAQSLISFANYESTGNVAFIYFMVLFAITACARLTCALFYDNAKRIAIDLHFGRRWENRYLIGASGLGCLIGVMVYLSIMSGDRFAEFASMTLAMATMVTIVGKNFASARIVRTFTTFCFAPIFCALISFPDWKHIAGAILLVPFAALIISMATYVRDFLRQAINGRMEFEGIAEQFDVAINHMPQGLILFDPNGKTVVVNDRAAQMMQTKSAGNLVGRRLSAIIRFARLNGFINNQIAGQVEERLMAMVAGTESRKYLMPTSDGGHIEFNAKRTTNGSSVLSFEDVSERVASENSIKRMARFDALSGLANRVYFKELVRNNLALVGPNSHVAFFVIDIDDFKHVNDSLGHLVGDDLLCRFADRLTMMIDERSCFSRFGGDEFVGIMSGFQSADAAHIAARDALNSLCGNFEVTGHSIAVTISSGIVVTEAKSFDMAQLMVKSDLALYDSKAKGKGISTLFAASMDESYQRRQRLKIDLKDAIRNRKLSVFYQPIIDAKTMRISVCEALCRWDHPELGPISPAIFIPLAEENGVISDLTRFMLEQACVDCMTWAPDVSVAVNLSAVDFRQSSIQEMVRVALAKSRLDPARLEVEITEGIILEDHVGASVTLQELKAAGIKIALDDFGTGYSSLSYLHTLPLDKVKIDQSFVKDIVKNPRSLKLVAGVTRLADELGLTVTVEGIETIEQFEALREHAHIDLAQGFLFGAALSPRGVATLIENVIPAPKSNADMVMFR